MIEKIDEKIFKEAEKILLKENLTYDEIQILLAVKNEMQFKEKMKKMIEFTS